MPAPTNSERSAGKKGRSEYISRCVRTIKHEEPGKPMNEVLGKCYGLWENSQKSKPKGGK